MFNSQPLSVVLGLIFIYLIYSLLGSLITEIIATNFQIRNFVLKHAIKKMLNDSAPSKERSFGSFFFKHPLIKALATGNFISRSPSYIKSETFSKVVLDLLRGKTIMAGESSCLAIEHSINTCTIAWKADEAGPVTIAGDTKDYMQSIWADSQGDTDKFRSLLEQWFNEMMDRATGWYKKYTQFILFVVGLSIAIIFNIDTVAIATKLHDNPALQEKVVGMAGTYLEKHPESAEIIQAEINADTTGKNPKRFDTLLFKRAGEILDNEVEQSNNLLGLGWDKGMEKTAIPGWILTALAISFGAPFWFDLLNKLMQFRGPVAVKTAEPAKN